jgi:hypothetical protein
MPLPVKYLKTEGFCKTFAAVAFNVSELFWNGNLAWDGQEKTLLSTNRVVLFWDKVLSEMFMLPFLFGYS